MIFFYMTKLAKIVLVELHKFHPFVFFDSFLMVLIIMMNDYINSISLISASGYLRDVRKYL